MGVTPVCDVVINHRAAEGVGPEGAYNQYGEPDARDVDDEGNHVRWGEWAITCDDPSYHGKGGPDSGENYHAAPDLDHSNPALRESLKRWMRWLKTEIGFGGFRFDFVRGYAPSYLEEYVRASFDPAADLVVGENWVDMNWEGSTLSYDQDGPRTKLVDWIASTHGVCALFDFVTKGALQRAVEHVEFWRLRCVLYTGPHTTPSAW